MNAQTSEPATDPSVRPHVLVVDDDPEIGRLLSRYLGDNGLRVSIAGNAAEVRRVLRAGDIDLMLLDLGLPDEDGLALMGALRPQWRGAVIIVSGRGESVERIVGLELGADDYVTKPFDLRELLARIRSVLRRARPAIDTTGTQITRYRFEGLCLDPASRRLQRDDDTELELTSGEFDLLLALVQRPQQVLSRDQLMNAVHGHDAGPFDRAIDVQIARLRRKLEDDPAHPAWIKSVRGAGYLFTPAVRRT